MRRNATIVLLILGLSLATAADDFWVKKDWKLWSSQDCLRIMETSPWAVEGHAEIISALITRQAMVRLTQIDQHYDKMKPEAKQQFDQLADACLNLNLDDRIIVRARGVYNPNMPNAMLYLNVSGRIIPAHDSPQMNAISPCPFISLDPQPTKFPGHDLVFPRVVDGKPVIQPDDKELIVGNSAWGDTSDGSKFDIEKMIYKGKLDY